MKLVLWSLVAAGAGILVAGTQPASAQSDRTLGVNCTVAGHVHCGENGPIGGPAYRRHGVKYSKYRYSRSHRGYHSYARY